MIDIFVSGWTDCKEIQPVHPKGDQSWVFIGGTDVEAELQYFGHLMRRADSFVKTLMLGKIEGRRRRGRQKMRWLDGITYSMTWLWIISRSWWYHLTISPSVVPFSSCLQSFPTSRSFQMSQLFASGGQNIGVQLQQLQQFQATILEWIAMTSSRGSSPPRSWNWINLKTYSFIQYVNEKSYNYILK